MTLICEIVVAGKTVGYSYYNTVSDMWGSATYDSFEEASLDGVFRTCADQEQHSLIKTKVFVLHSGERTQESPYELRWCSECRAVVTPPFDDYEYHQYGCAMSPCSCEEIP